MASQLAGSVAERPVARLGHTSFFFAMSAAMLAIVLIGFAPTLYLRPVFSVPPIPVRAYVHGFVMTAWFLCLFAQTTLIRGGNYTRHRQLGIVGTLIAIAVVITGLSVTLGAPDRFRAFPGIDFASDISVLGIGSGTTIAGFLSFVVWSNLSTAVTFSVLLTSAIVFRRQSEVHKRLMLVASLSLLGPAIARISRWPGLGGDTGALVPITLLVLLSAIVVHDLITTKRVHPATIIGGAAAILGNIAAQSIATSGFGQAFAMGL